MKVREYIKTLETSHLLKMFQEMDDFEISMVVPEDADLRIVATTFMDNNALSMLFVAHEVWRELAVRGHFGNEKSK